MQFEHRLELSFQRSHIPEPIICEMARRFENLMFNIVGMSVGVSEAKLQIALIGEPSDLRKVCDYFTSLGAKVQMISETKYKHQPPSLPTRTIDADDDEPSVEKKLWLTLLGSIREQPFFWVLSRRFDVTYKFMQSVTGESISIVSILIWGPRSEVNDAVSYLREQGVNVEYGDVAVSAPFTPVG